MSHGYSEFVRRMNHMPTPVVFSFGFSPILQYVGTAKAYGSIILATLTLSDIDDNLDENHLSPLFVELNRNQLLNGDPLRRPRDGLPQATVLLWLGDASETIQCNVVPSKYSNLEYHVVEVNPAPHGVLKTDMLLRYNK